MKSTLTTLTSLPTGSQSLETAPAASEYIPEERYLDWLDTLNGGMLTELRIRKVAKAHGISVQLAKAEAVAVLAEQTALASTAQEIRGQMCHLLSHIAERAIADSNWASAIHAIRVWGATAMDISEGHDIGHAKSQAVAHLSLLAEDED